MTMKMRIKRLIVALGLGLGLSIGLAQVLSLQGVWAAWSPAAPLAPAATCTVDDDGGADYTTVQEAVDDETCTTIQVAGGEYPENVVITRSLTLVGEIADTPDIYNVERAFLIDDPDVHVSISNFYLAANSADYGPAIYNQGTLTVTNVEMMGNDASYSGGAIYNEGTLTLVDSSLTENVAAMNGGGIYNDGDLVIAGSDLGGNTADSHGGGVYNAYRATLVLTDVAVILNTADSSGGGLYNYGGDATIVNSAIEENTAESSGGGIYSVLGATTVDHTDVLTNTASVSYGGGIGVEDALTVTHSVIRANTAYMGGGGIYVGSSGTLSLSDSTVSDNSGVTGGGVYGTASGSYETCVDISTSEISHNSATNGGGLYVKGRTTVEYSSLSDNSSSSTGGGIVIGSGHLTVTHTTISTNTAGHNAGGIRLSYDGTMTLTNVTVSGNEADVDGGGISVNSGSASLNSVTIAYNTADADADDNGNGGGIYNSSGTVTVRNTIIAENDDLSSTTERPDCSGSYTSNAYNLIGDKSGCSGFNTVWDQYGTSSSPLDPYLYPLGEYGGPTLVHALKYGKFTGKSPAVDAGPPSNYPAVDQRGWPRPTDGDGDGEATCDVGAAERDGTTPANPVITKTVSSATAEPGDQITYTLIFSNAGGLTATGVVITDTLPTRVSLVNVVSSGVAITQVAGTRAIWQVQDLESGQGGVITLTGVLTPPQASGAFTNDAVIAADIDGDPDDSSDSAAVTVANVPPVAKDRAKSLPEPYRHDGLAGWTFVLRATDPNGDALTYGLLITPTNGAFFIFSTGISYYSLADRTSTYTDVATYVVTDAHSLTDTGTITVIVTCHDDPPVISNVPNSRTDAGVATGPISFTVDDADTSLDDLTLSAASSDEALVPLSNVAFGGSGADRTVTVTPTGGMTGTATITVTVNDATSSDEDPFLLVVGPGNTPPDIVSTPVPTATEDVAYTYPVTATDVDTGDVLTLTAILTPTWLGFTDHGDGTATLSGTPLNDDVGDHGVVLQVEDSASGTGTQAFTITVLNVNDPPVALDDTPNATEDLPIDVAVLANDDDVDGDTLSVAAVGVPDYGSAAISGTLVVYMPTNRRANYSAAFTYTVSDGELSDEGQVTVSVAANDDPPVILDDIPDRQTYAGTPVGPLPFTVDDLDTPLDDLTLSRGASDTALVPLANITFGGSGAGRTVTVTPTAGLTGTVTITVTASDAASSAHETFGLTVVGNRSPAFTSPPVTAATEDAVYTYNLTATDPDAGDALTFTAATKPGWLLFTDHHDSTATLTGKPANTDVGDHAVTLRVEDDAGATDTQSFTITVANVNDPPLAVDDVSYTDEDTPVSVDVLTNDDDADGDPLSLVAVGQPLLGSVSVVAGSVTYTPADRPFYYSAIFTYTVSDGSRVDTGGVIVDVDADDDPPGISNILNQKTDEGVPAGPIPFTVGDPDTPAGLLGLFSASSDTALVPPGNVAFGGSGTNRTVTVTPTAGLSGTATITVRVFDGESTASDAFVLAVGEVNGPPEFGSMPVTTATENVAYTYHVTATDVNAGDVLTITAVTRPDWLTLTDHHDRTASLDGTPADDDVGDHAVTLRVEDDDGAASTQSFTITVSSGTNQSPAADAGSDQTVSVNALVTLDGSGSTDPDGNLPLIYGWAQVGGPSVAISGSTTVSPTFTAVDGGSVLTFALVVTDALGLASPPDTVVVTVEHAVYLPLVLKQ